MALGKTAVTVPFSPRVDSGLGKIFTRQKALSKKLCRLNQSRVSYVEGGTWQSFCQMLFSLYGVPLALGKYAIFGSDKNGESKQRKG